jgi:hypothetical protein
VIADDRNVDQLLCDLMDRATILRDAAARAMEYATEVSPHVVDILARDILREAEEVMRRIGGTALEVEAKPAEVTQ